MAKAIAKCTCSKCGKEFEVIKNFYSRKEAMSFEEWMESNPSLICPDCRKAIEDAAIDERSAGMPELTGTEKQIAWARKIRLSMIEALDRLAKEELIDGDGNPHAEGLRIYKLAIADMIAEHTDAAWWIENRNAVDVNWFWAALMNPAIENHSNTAEEATETTEEATTKTSEELARAYIEEICIENTMAATDAQTFCARCRRMDDAEYAYATRRMQERGWAAPSDPEAFAAAYNAILDKMDSMRQYLREEDMHRRHEHQLWMIACGSETSNIINRKLSSYPRCLAELEARGIKIED